jgi:hypothetical protein
VARERRFPGSVPRLVGKVPSEYDPNYFSMQWDKITKFLYKLGDSVTGGIPAGASTANPSSIEPNAVADPGSYTSGWAPADHVHAIATGVASGLADANAEGSATSFSRSDHQHKRDLNVQANSVLTGTRNAINVRADTGVVVTGLDVPAGDRVDVQIGLSNRIPRWYDYSFNYANFSAAALTNSIELFSLPGACAIHAVSIKHSVAFGGGAIASYTLEVGIVGDTSKYALPFDVFSAPSDTNFYADAIFGMESWAATSIKVTATSTGANLDAANVGTVTIQVFWSALA